MPTRSRMGIHDAPFQEACNSAISRTLMKGHFLQPFARDAVSPFVREVRRRWPEATFEFGALSGLTYRKRAWLYFVGWPRLLWFGLRAGRRAFTGEVRPDVIVANSDLEVIGLALARLIYKQAIPIVLVGFIFTPRASAITDTIRRAYFRAVLGQTKAVVCSSSFEAQRYRGIFRLKETDFISIPYGLHVWDPGVPKVSSAGYVLSAGRSGRDYSLLGRVFATLSYELRIVCDSEEALRGLTLASNVSVLRHCYGKEYLEQIAGAELVVVPLKDDDISAGQMVLLQSMALAKPVVITRTPATEEYGKHLETLYFVEHGSMQDLVQAVMHLKANPELRESIGRRAQEHFQERHSMRSFVQRLLDVIEGVLSGDTAS
jgi:glycosyltransferase involved in cell wall biosynthesis